MVKIRLSILAILRFGPESGKNPPKSKFTAFTVLTFNHQHQKPTVLLLFYEDFVKKIVKLNDKLMRFDEFCLANDKSLDQN